MDELEYVARTHGVFLRGEAVDAGYDDKALVRALRAGVLVRVRHGAYTFSDLWGPAAPEERHLIRAAAVARQAQEPQVLSHTTAALRHGADVWDLPLSSVHVTRSSVRGGRNEAGVIRHRGRLAPCDVVDLGGCEVTAPLRTALDVTTITDVEHALVVVSSMLHSGSVSQEAFRAAAADPVWTRVPGSLTTGLVGQLADARFESVGESRTAYALWTQGIPRPTPQYEVRDHRGVLVAELDFAWPNRGVWLEFDGLGKYLKFLREGETPADAVVREKKREDLVRRLTRWTCERAVWSDLSRPAALAERLRRAFADQSVSRPA